jgi:hypothetical protein
MNNRERKPVAWKPFRSVTGRSTRYNRDPAPVEGLGTPGLRQAATLRKPARVYDAVLPQKPRVPRPAEGAQAGSGGTPVRTRRTYVVHSTKAEHSQSAQSLERASNAFWNPISSHANALGEDDVTTIFPSTAPSPTGTSSAPSPPPDQPLQRNEASAPPAGPKPGLSFAEKLRLARYRRAYGLPALDGSTEQQQSNPMENDEPIEQSRSQPPWTPDT